MAYTPAGWVKLFAGIGTLLKGFQHMWSRLWVWCLGLAWGVAAAQALPPVQVSILPTLTAKALLTQYQPLRVYLERELQRLVPQQEHNSQ